MKSSRHFHPLEIFRRLSARWTPFYSANVTHCGLRSEARKISRKSRRFRRFWRNLAVISLALDIFRRLNARWHPFYTANATHYGLSVETSKIAGKSRRYRRFWRVLTVISFPLEIFRRLSARWTPFYTANVMHYRLSVETSKIARKSRRFRLFGRKLTVISFPLEIIRRFSAR